MGFNDVIELTHISFMIMGLVLILPFVFTIRIVKFLNE